MRHKLKHTLKGIGICRGSSHVLQAYNLVALQPYNIAALS